MSAVAVLSVILWSCLPLVFATQPDIRLIDQGKRIYRQHCIHCHGNSIRLFQGLDKPSLQHVIQAGKGLMPGFAGQLTAEQLDQLWLYIASKI